MITLSNVTKYYPTKHGRKYVLRNVSQTLPSGVNIGVFGANGTGKSTLLKLLGSVDFPNHGRIDADCSISWPMGLAGGYQGSLTGRDNAKFICRVYGASERLIKEKLAFIQEFAEIGDYFDMPVKTYSAGMRARLTFAVCMAFDFDVYLIDELTAVGDKRFREKSKAAMDAKKTQANFIMASHNIENLVRQCDVGIFVCAGELYVYHDIEQAVLEYNKVQELPRIH